MLAPGAKCSARASSPGRRTTIRAGIGTYSQVGAQFGFSLAWIMVFAIRYSSPRS
jgi:hypothetical protein